tara:strand:- start:66 stop:1013 length:948 start_codon:yes stop_codon:yes gene_type:complete
MKYGSPKLLVDVVKHEHANMDSFPFRYGIHFERTTRLDLFNCKNYEWQEFEVKFKVEANFVGKNGVIEKGIFIIMYTDFPNPKVVTVIREGIETEIHLSSLLKSLRKANTITPQKLMDLHPLYIAGEANTFEKLAARLYSGNNKTTIANDELETIKIEAKRQAEEDYKKTLLELEKENERIRAIANKAIKGMSEAGEALGEKEIENKKLQDENKKLQDEIEQGKQRGSNVVVDEVQILINVETNVMYRGSINTILTMKDGSKKTIKVETFDKTLAITKKAQSLIGKKVKTTAWDPINDPGKWSSQGYFRHIYEVD